MVRRDPREKKALSYARDRRNDWGENDKTSRKSIRLRKRLPNRANRHHARQVLAGAPSGDAEARLILQRVKRWRKYPDAPLGEMVERKLRRRADLGMADPATVEAHIERIRRAR